MLGCIVQNVQEHLAQPLGITGDLGNILVRIQIFQRDPLLGKAGAVHEHRILKFTADIGLLHVQGHSSILHPGKVQQLHDHLRQALCLAGDDLHALAGISVHGLIGQQRLGPAVDDRQGGTQLMGELGDEFSLHLLILADLAGQFIDGLRQFADLIGIAGLDLHAVAAAGNPFGFFVDLFNRDHHGIDKIIAAQDHNTQNDQQNKKGDECDNHDLPVHQLGGGDKPEYADYLAVGIDHGSGDRHDPFSGGRVLPQVRG